MKEHDESVQAELRGSSCDFVAMARWDGFTRIGEESTIDVVYAMLVRYSENVAYRVAIVAFNAKEWEGAEPVEQSIVLG